MGTSLVSFSGLIGKQSVFINKLQHSHIKKKKKVMGNRSVPESEEVLEQQHKARCKYVERVQKQHLKAKGETLCATK